MDFLFGGIMRLTELLSFSETEIYVKEVKNFRDCEITSVSSCSSQVKNGAMFFCVKGEKADGHDFAFEAIKNGAVCVVCEKPLDAEVCQIIVDNSDKAQAAFSNAFFGFPTKKLKIICVVGTNGKTSTAVLINSVLKEAGYKTGLISTNGIWIGEDYEKNDMTTPCPCRLYELFFEMQKQKVNFCVMEMSAHAIKREKLFQVEADLAVFTNFSQDHLDYFKNMQNYADTKMSFFKKGKTKIAVVNADDKIGRELIFNAEVPTVSYGIDNPSDVFAMDVECEKDFSSYIMNIYDEVYKMEYPLTGKFNVYNTLAAATACRVFGIKPDVIGKGIRKIKFIEGRNQAYRFPQGFKVVIDYAHTPEGIENILSHLKASTFGKLITVFGCGGNRDKSKRKIMAESVSKYSDYAVLTSDNPRYEDPYEIMFEAEKGLSVNHELMCDRKAAITRAIGKAEKDDVVAVLGKGHEKYQEIKGEKLPFSDAEIVLELLCSVSPR